MMTFLEMYRIFISYMILCSAFQILEAAGVCEENSFNVTGYIISKSTDDQMSSM